MFFKILVLILVLMAVYYIFFNKSEKKNRKKHHHKENDKISGETMIECAKCGTYVSAKEAIIKDGKYYCSTECANDSN